MLSAMGQGVFSLVLVCQNMAFGCVPVLHTNMDGVCGCYASAGASASASALASA